MTADTHAQPRVRPPRYRIAAAAAPSSDENKASKSRVVRATARFSSRARNTNGRLWLRIQMHTIVTWVGVFFIVFTMIFYTNVAVTDIRETPHQVQTTGDQNVRQRSPRPKSQTKQLTSQQQTLRPQKQVQSEKDRIRSHDKPGEIEKKTNKFSLKKQEEDTNTDTKEEHRSAIIRKLPLMMVQMLEDNTVSRLGLVWDLEPTGRKNKFWRDHGTENYLERSRPKEGCVPLGDWQEGQHPTCNMFHDIPLNELVHPEGYELARLVNNGAYRDVWGIREFDGTRRVLKALRYTDDREFDQRNFDRHRRDAVATEQLSASPYIVDIFGYCANSALYDYAPHGDLYGVRDSKPSKNDLLIIAHDVAASIADAHHYDSKGRATIAHTDIKPNQFINIDGKYQLSDFNRCRFLTWDPEREEHCGFTVGKNGGKWRSPEEYKYEPETEKIDVFSLGYVLYFLLTDEFPFKGMKSKDANDFVAKGGRLKVTDEDVLGSTHLFETTVLKAMDMCFASDPKERPSAREVANFLQRAVQRIET